MMSGFGMRNARELALCSMSFARNGTMAMSFPSRRALGISSRRSRSRASTGTLRASVSCPSHEPRLLSRLRSLLFVRTLSDSMRRRHATMVARRSFDSRSGESSSSTSCRYVLWLFGSRATRFTTRYSAKYWKYSDVTRLLSSRACASIFSMFVSVLPRMKLMRSRATLLGCGALESDSKVRMSCWCRCAVASTGALPSPLAPVGEPAGDVPLAPPWRSWSDLSAAFR
mmetsp:Transcript_48773/g.150629  ORF Transcript_48773/g.150629 Transcript_48773/m.150629 type:complete len:228 (-) Transcript_48773:2293-2976(-)